MNRKSWQEMLADDENRGIADAERQIQAMLNQAERIKRWALHEF